MMGDDNQLPEYFATAKRTLKLWLPIMVGIFILGVLIAYKLPPVYQSIGTILIEQQEIPQDLVRTTVTTYADQRIQVISQQVMTRSNLLEIVRKYDLYTEKRKKEPVEVVLKEMRDDILLNMISADVVDPVSGRPTNATIAFTLAYQSARPDLAQKVANELASLYLNENLKARREMATEAARFLTDEAERLSTTIVALESKLAVFKEGNSGMLPEMMDTNLQLLNRTESQLYEIDRQIRADNERIIYLDSELTRARSLERLYSESGERIPGPKDRLRELEAKYLRSSVVYAEDHPDNQRLGKEIAALKAQISSGVESNSRSALLERKKIELTELEKVYAADHPDVKKLRREISSLQEGVDNQASTSNRMSSAMENPAYIQLAAQLKTAIIERDTLQENRQKLQAQYDQYQAFINQTPRVERDYRHLVRDYDNAMAKYREIRAKQMEAQLAMELETERKGERFTLIDPPQLPEEPVSPNRPLIVLLGTIMALASGIACIVLAKSLDTTIRSARSLELQLGLPIGVIPAIATVEDIRADRARLVIMLTGLVCIVAAAAVLFHYFYLPLDVAWYMGLSRMGW